MEKEIVQTWFFQHSPKKVWDYLTKQELLAQWLMENDFKPVVGHKFKFTSKPRVKVGFDGIVYCEVLEIIPLEKLSYSWKGGPGKGKITLDSVVVWTLKPLNNGTELTLQHKGFKGLRNFIPYLIMTKGWEGKIKERITQLLYNDIHETI